MVPTSTSRMTRRRGIYCLIGVLCSVVLAGAAWRIVQRRRAPNARVAQLTRLRTLAWHIDAYAKEYGRPAFYLDSVQRHSSSADAKQFADLEIDLWGDSVYYMWTYCGFELARPLRLSPGDARRLDLTGRYLFDSTTGIGYWSADIAVIYQWPPSDGRSAAGDPSAMPPAADRALPRR